MTFHEHHSSQEIAASMYPSMEQATTPPPPKPEPPALPEGTVPSRTTAELGEAIYGPKPTPAAQPQAEATKPSTEQPIQAVVPDEIKELRAQDSARRLYSPQATYREVLPDTIVADVEGIDPKVATVAIAEMREMAADFGASTQDVQEFRRAFNSVPAEITTELRTQWHEQTVERLNAEFGSGAAAALRDAQALVRRDPRMAQMLNQSGAGDHPSLALLFARMARTARSKGKLKK